MIFLSLCFIYIKQKGMNEQIKQIANSFAMEYCSDAIYPSHLFKAILHKEIGLIHFIETELDKDYYYLQEWADVQMALSPRATKPSRDLNLSEEAFAVLEEAEAYQMRLGLDECEPVCVLASLVTPGVGFTFEQLKTLPMNASEICDKLGGENQTHTTMTSPSIGGGSSKGGMIQKYCINKSEEALAGKLGQIVGFENEISTIICA
jgi:ATP-dependent Clp protease ATP-binding subunit ClpA